MSRIRVNSIKPIGGDSVSVSGSLVVTGNVTAEEFVTERVSTSIIYKSGSTKFGDTADDRHEFTGTLDLTGSALISSTLGVGGITDLETYVTVATGSININETDIATLNTQVNVATSSITTNETDIATLNTQVNVATASINVNETNITTLTGDLTVATASINVNETNIGTLTTDLSVATASISANEATIGAINAATSSYALATDLTVATGSINVNEVNIGLLTAITGSLVSTQTAYNTVSGSYITSASIGDYVKKDLLKAIVTGSADFDAFKTAILGL